MAEVNTSKVANWRGTWIHYAYLRLQGFIRIKERMEDNIDRIKSVIRQAAESAGVEYIFFGEKEGIHVYTSKASFKDVVDEEFLKRENPEMYDKCCKKVFDPDKFLELATSEQKKIFVETKQTRAGSQRFDTAKSVKVVFKKGTKAKTFRGEGDEYKKSFMPLEEVRKEGITEDEDIMVEVAKDLSEANGSAIVLDDLTAVSFITKPSDTQDGFRLR